MASLTATTKAFLAAPQAKACTNLRAMSVVSKPAMGQSLMAVRKVSKAERRNATTVQAFSGVEVAQIAGEAGFIGGVAGVMVGITLVGLAFGFILLRVESLAEEGKI
ncbi:hypothetical protein Ndes2526B_g06521 [Nannochloris sp. 'desiccata']